MAQDNRISREAQDGIAHQSHVRAAAAWADGRYAQEVMTVQVPPKYDAPVSEDNLVRKDSVFAKLGLHEADYVDNPQAVIEVLVAHPKLLQRPVVVRGEVALIGRPKERVRELLSKT